MNSQEFEKVVLDAMRQIAPDIDPADVNRSGELREEFDIDSMDFLNLVTRLSKECSISIPESDYRSLGSLDALIEYLERTVTA